MKYLKSFEYYVDGSYPGPNLVNSADAVLAAGASDGMIAGGAGFGMTGAMGGEFPKNPGANSGEFPLKYDIKIKQVKNKKWTKYKELLKKVTKNKIVSFDDFKTN